MIDWPAISHEGLGSSSDSEQAGSSTLAVQVNLIRRFAMKTSRSLSIVVLLGFSCLMSAAEKGAWQSLFNGKDLAGWKNHGQEKWIVENGEILGEAVTKEYGYLATIKTYKNFEMKGQFKAEGTGNSGIFYHSTLDGVDIKGVQVEVDPNPGKHTGGLYESGGREWLVMPSEAGEKALKVGEWNDVQFSVVGNHVVSYVNGIKAVDYTDPSPRYFDGVIALQLHAGGEGKMRFKNLYVREIK
jgi:3-keto-disaccharide hydrolase